MNRILLVLLPVFIAAAVSAQSIDKRIVHNDPASYRELSSVHAGAGKMGFTQLIGRTELSTNFLYLHAGVIYPKGGIGHHFHHGIEEMYVLLNGEAEFTVNGRTSLLKAPVVVPCKMGDAHAIYNAGNEPLRWLNFAVSRTKGVGDAFDLGDNRVGAKKDAIPVFISSQLQRDKLKADDHPYAGNGARYRQVIGPEIFNTPWNSVGHVVIPAGKSAGPRQLEGKEEVYFIMKGSGKLTVGSASHAIKTDDSFFGLLGETVTLSNDGNEDLELLVIGIAVSPSKDPNIHKPLTKPKAIALQMDFVVPKENCEAFEKMYYSIYVPAMTVQQGYLESKLIRLFPGDVSKQIEAEPTTYNYQIQISFDTEENRRKWVASEHHKIAWPAASSLATSYKWRGYDVMGDDFNK